jgi:hypothetical protein
MGANVLGKLQAPTSTTQTSNPNPFGQLIGLGTGIAGLGTGNGGTIGGSIFNGLFN